MFLCSAKGAVSKTEPSFGIKLVFLVTLFTTLIIVSGLKGKKSCFLPCFLRRFCTSFQKGLSSVRAKKADCSSSGA